MLTRIISGAVGVGLMIVVFIFHDTFVLPFAVAAMIAVMLFELLRAVKLEKCFPIYFAVELCGIFMPFIRNQGYNWRSVIERSSDYVSGVNYIGAEALSFFVTLAAVLVILITWLKKHNELRYEQVFFAIAVTILVPQAMSTMVRIDRTYGLFFLILALCGAWIADTGAYFTGVAFGKHKLCPEISPKKTIEGFVGGIVTTGIVFTAAVSVHDGSFVPGAFIIGAVCAVIGTVGDLSASMVKRQIGFKDYGKIMPGHGGLMDRFDSVLFVLPTFYAFNVIFDLMECGII